MGAAELKRCGGKRRTMSRANRPEFGGAANGPPWRSGIVIVQRRPLGRGQ